MIVCDAYSDKTPVGFTFFYEKESKRKKPGRLVEITI